MLKIIIIMVTIGIWTSCENNGDDIAESNEFVGKWKLVEQYVDPGDGSGEYEPITSNKTIEFFKNGTFKSNGDICKMLYTTSDGNSSGVYLIEEKILVSNTCDDNFKIQFYLEDEKLVLIFQCIEGCGQKYIRVE